MQRYSRQTRFAELGEHGQRRLGYSHAAIVGCGALGSVIANTLTRAGVGRIKLIDRDVVELSNLQRQVLYTESDVAEGLPKAIAAANHLRGINSSVEVEPVVADVTAGNIESICDSVDLVLDGSDNFEIRFLINDFCVKHGIPWIYGGCLGADGQTMTIVPGDTACLNCLMLQGPPPPGTTETCDSFGILSPIINLIASIESMEAIKLLSGNREAISRKLQVFSLWTNDVRQIDLSKLRDQVDCPACQQQTFVWLDGKRGSQTTVLCGRNSVQLTFPERGQIDLASIAKRLSDLGDVRANEYLVKFDTEEIELTIFEDGRAIVTGTDDPALARKYYAQYLGQ
ncbi:MAG: ThiF family adenylyltransferase [Planctomycetota bacterium]